MKITIYIERGMNIDLNCIVKNMCKLASDIKFVTGKTDFLISSSIISAPDSYKELSEDIISECKGSDEVVLFTEKPYDNNYFWEGFENKHIISLFGWDHLTTIKYKGVKSPISSCSFKVLRRDALKILN